MVKRILKIALPIVIVLAIVVGVYWYYHPTNYLFNDRAILGSTEEEIVNMYGEFTKVSRNDAGDITYGTYMLRGNTPEMIMGYDSMKCILRTVLP